MFLQVEIRSFHKNSSQRTAQFTKQNNKGSLFEEKENRC